jgi:uncharacterized membrane protein YkoI
LAFWPVSVLVSALTDNRDHTFSMRYRTTLLAAISILLYAGQVLLPNAQPAAFAHDEEHDEEQARHALEMGEILPLDRVIAGLRDTVPGEVSAVELEKENGTWIYELKVISPDGRMLQVRVDAKTGQLISKAGR